MCYRDTIMLLPQCGKIKLLKRSFFMKKLISILLFVLVIACAVSAHEFYMDNVSFNDVEKVIIATKKMNTFKTEKYTIAPSDLYMCTFQYIIVRSNGKVFYTFSDNFITDAPIVDGKGLSKPEKDKYLKD